MKYSRYILLLLVLLTACTKHGADEDPIESSSIPINGQGTDPLYARLLAVLGDLPPLATLIESGIVDDVLCRPHSCAGTNVASCSLVLNLADDKRDLCVRALKANAVALRDLGSKSPTSIFREATRPLVMVGGDGQRRRMTMMTRPGTSGHVAIDRAMAMALSYYDFVQAVLHELIGHRMRNPATGAFGGDLSPSPPFLGNEAGRNYADTVAAAAVQLILDNLATMPGTVDHTFNDSGTVLTAPAGGNGEVIGISCQDDGTTVATGNAGLAVAVARYLRDGTLDPTFGANGFSTFQSGTQANMGVSVTPEGDKTLVAGFYLTTGVHAFVARLNRTGQLDATFGGTGMVSGPFDTFLPTYSSMAAQVHTLANGRHLVVGIRYDANVAVGYVMRLNAQNQRDTTYGMPVSGNAAVRYGYVTNPVQTNPQVGQLLYASAVTPDEGLYLVTYGRLGGNPSAAPMLWLSRYTPGGVLDVTFGNGTGMFGIELESDDVLAYLPNPRVLLQPDGAIVVSGFSARSVATTERFRLLVARIRPDGSDYDTSFGSSGRFLVPLSASTRLRFGDLALQPNGKILVAAGALRATWDFMVLRLNGNGTEDPSFNGGEPVFKDFGTRQDSVRSMCLQPGGKIVLGGTSSLAAAQWALARFNNH